MFVVINRTPRNRQRFAVTRPGLYSARVGQSDNTQQWYARTERIADPGPLVEYLSATDGALWLRRGQGFVAAGIATSVTVDSIEAADQWWSEFSARIQHHTQLPDAWGTGPLAVGSFPFDPHNTSTPATFAVPRVIVGTRAGTSWITVLSDSAEMDMTLPAAATLPLPAAVIGTEPVGLDPADWAAAVDEGRARVASGDLSKVVLARGQAVTTAEPIDVRWLARRLCTEYENTWTYLLDGLVGASPEMLVRRQKGLATSRVLAGTIPRSGDETEDLRLAAALARSGKNLIEHELAVASVAEAMAPLCSGMNVPDAPYVLQLPNVFHLASDITGVCHPHATALTIAGQLHPTAAVCGTPTNAARQVIADIEHLDRGRYAGPVGWIDTHGDGEWAIALRCGFLDPSDSRRLSIYAGAGIVAESDPAEELIETDHKMTPLRSALGLSTAVAGS